MIVLDTTVLVYATGSDHPLREPCRRLIQAVGDGVLDATTTVEVVQEFVHVRARRRSRSDAVALGTAFADLLAPPLPLTFADLSAGLRLYAEHDRLGAFDAVLAAAATALSADALVSADLAFSTVAQLRHLVPDAESVDALLTAAAT